MGGPQVLPGDDTLWRTWENDQKFLLTPALSQSFNFTGKINYMDGNTEEIAPPVVYATVVELTEAAQNTIGANVNMTWQFSVDANSDYLMRFHFCDIVGKSGIDMLFNVYINARLASDVDLGDITFNTLDTAVFMDFVLKADAAAGKLSVSISPSPIINGLPNAILNGLEIMKISGSAAPAVVVKPPGSNKNFGIILGSILGAVAVVVVAIILCVVLRKRKVAKQSSKTWVPFSIDGLTSHSTVSQTSNETAFKNGQNGDLGYRFSFTVLQEATNSFDESWVIGVGGFGKVYKGALRDETKVAVKRGNPKSQQGLNEFRTEIELLSPAPPPPGFSYRVL
ncbi:unnamed protein product [Musa textilis]